MRSSRGYLSELQEHCILMSYPAPIIALDKGISGLKPGQGAFLLNETSGGYHMGLPRSEKTSVLYNLDLHPTEEGIWSFMFSHDTILSWDDDCIQSARRWNSNITAAHKAFIADVPAIPGFHLMKNAPMFVPAGMIISLSLVTSITYHILLGVQAMVPLSIAVQLLPLTGVQMSILSMALTHITLGSGTPYHDYNTAKSKFHIYYNDSAAILPVLNSGPFECTGYSALRVSSHLTT